MNEGAGVVNFIEDSDTNAAQAYDNIQVSIQLIIENSQLLKSLFR